MDWFHKFLFLTRGASKGYVWSRRRLTKVQTTARPDRVWPEVWPNLSKASKRRAKQEWTNERPKLENTHRMRGIYLVDLEDKEYE